VKLTVRRNTPDTSIDNTDVEPEMQLEQQQDPDQYLEIVIGILRLLNLLIRQTIKTMGAQKMKAYIPRTRNISVQLPLSKMKAMPLMISCILGC
jgi:hypothetical protein